MQSKLAILFLVIILLASSWALLAPGMFAVHDFVHAARLSEMHRALSDGHFPVRWSGNFGYGFGMPLFQFYGPLPYYVGTIFYGLLGVSVTASVKIIFFLSSLGTLIASYLLGIRLFKSPLSAVVLSAAITLAPYRAVNLFVRGAVNEAWGMMGAVFVLLAIILIYQKSRWGVVVFSLSIALMATSHNLVTFLFVPFSLLFIISLLLFDFFNKKKDARSTKHFLNFELIKNYAFGGILGTGVSSFYIIPAFFEKHFTQVEKFVTTGFFDYIYHFLYIRQFLKPNWNYGGSILGPDDDMSFFLGYGQIAAALLLIGLLGFNLFVRRKKQWFIENGFILLIMFVAGFSSLIAAGLSLQHALPVWQYFDSILAFVQFPWRYLSVISIFLGILAAGGIYLIKDKKARIIVSVILLISIFVNAQYFQPQSFEDVSSEMYYTEPDRISKEMSGILPDYLPQGFDPENVEIDSGPACDSSSCEIKQILSRQHEHIFTVSAQEDFAVVLPVADYPGWQLYLNGSAVSHSTRDGLIEFTHNQGEHVLSLKFENTNLRLIADLISSFSIMILAALAIKLMYSTKKMS